jgi:hypothetical protein
MAAGYETTVPGRHPREFAKAHGRAVVAELREALRQSGFDCDQVCAVGDDWGFLVEPERSPIGVSVEYDDRSGQWAVRAAYDGGLSALWGSERRREARVLVRRVENVLASAVAGRRDVSLATATGE